MSSSNRIHDVIVRIDLQEETFEYNFDELNLTFVPSRVKLTRISIISDTDVDKDPDNRDPVNIFSVYMNGIIDPLCEFIVDGTCYSLMCNDEFICSNVGLTTKFTIAGLFDTETIGPNTIAGVVLHLRFS